MGHILIVKLKEAENAAFDEVMEVLKRRFDFEYAQMMIRYCQY